MRKHRSTIFPATWKKLAAQRADVLVTHEAPSGHPYGWQSIDLLARKMGVHTVVHGHHHDRLDYSARASIDGFRTIGLGLRGISNLEGTVIRPGELDADRATFRRSQ